MNAVQTLVSDRGSRCECAGILCHCTQKQIVAILMRAPPTCTRPDPAPSCLAAGKGCRKPRRLRPETL